MNTPTDKEVRDWYMGYGVEGRAELASVEGDAFDRYLLERDAKTEKVALSWERERFDRLWQIEKSCGCESPMQHLKIRMDRTQIGIDYTAEFAEGEK
jgi:hypothetical protein